MSQLVDIGLYDELKSGGGGGMEPPATPAPAGLCRYRYVA